MKEDFIVQKAAAEDREKILEMIRKEFPYFSLTEQELWERIRSKNIAVFKASSRKKFAGFIEVEFLNGNEARINGLTIKEEYRGKKAATKLLEKAIGFLKRKNIERVRLLVKQSNETAKKLYRQYGFQFTGLYNKKLDNEVVEEMELPLIEETPKYAA